MKPYYEHKWGVVYHGDCLEVMRDLPDNSVDTCITDPPYALEFMGQGWDKVLPSVDVWREVLRVMKPGAILLSFGGTRTYHRLTCAIEDAGFEIRDCLMWLYGQGFPKSLDISKAIDKAAGHTPIDAGESPNWRESKRDRERFGSMEVRGVNAGRITAPATDAARTWDGYGTALKPAYEPIVLAMKPLDGTFAENALKWGVAGLAIDAGRIPTQDNLNGGAYAETGIIRNDGWGMQRAGAGEYKQPLGRWPANVLLDEDAAAILDEQSGQSATKRIENPSMCDEEANTWGGTFQRNRGARGHTDSGGASRFFYTAKASRSERDAGLDGMPLQNPPQEYGLEISVDDRDNRAQGERTVGKIRNNHPTVKPLALMEYLCKLTRLPTGGVVLDPFMGSGTTGKACVRTGRNFIGIEKEEHYCKIAIKRLSQEVSLPPDTSPDISAEVLVQSAWTLDT